METIDHIPIHIKIEDVQDALRLKTKNSVDQVNELLKRVNPLISAQAGYRVSYIEGKFEDAVDIDGVRFTSRVLRKNLDPVQRVFPYVITIGAALEKTADACSDILEQYYLDVIGNIAVRKARNWFKKRLCTAFALDGVSYMSPGSLTDWPIEEQRGLFSILGNVTDAINVKLGETFLMMPKKSISGIYFATTVTFYNCQLCPRERCPGRKSRYNPDLAREYGVIT